MLKQSAQRGLGVVEVLISTGIMAVVLAVIFTFVVRSFTPPRQQYEQGKITEEARLQLNRVSDILRNAINVDFNGNGQIDSSIRQEQWLQVGGDYEVAVYTLRDVGGQDRLEYVRLWLENSDLKLQVSAFSVGACFAPDYELTVARGVRNITENVPLFSYYFGQASKLPPPIINPTGIKRVRLDLIVDSDVQQLPLAARIQTEIKPRKGMYAVTLLGSPPACGDCIDNDFDGRVDTGAVLNTLSDPGCTDAADTSEKGSLQCDDNFDNDTDTTTDYLVFGGGDTTCTSPAGTSEGPTPTPSPTPAPTPCVPGETAGVLQCVDGADNDCDGAIDYPADTQCGNTGHNNEASTNHQCNDGLDNDNNGKFDFQGAQKDTKCVSSGDKSEWQAGQQ